MMRTVLLLILFFPMFLWAQDDLLEDLENETTIETSVAPAFKGLKVVNFESTKLAAKGDLYFIVSHRFGTVKNGFDDFFGLDNAVTQLKFIYGICDKWNVGIARSSLSKKYGFHVKYKAFEEGEGQLPFTLAGYALGTINTSLDKDLYPNIEFSDRLTYTFQALLSKRVNNELSLLLAPTYIRENLATRSIVVESDGTTSSYDEENDQFAIGMGGRYKISRRVSINMDYGIHLNRNSNSIYKNPLSVGVDIETGGHVFQLHFTNAQAMFEEGFLVQGQGDWGDGDFFFGFNLSRVF